MSAVECSPRHRSTPHADVRLVGELDASTCDAASRACLATDQLAVRVDLSGLTFMDCGGYSGLIAARRDLERRGGTLTLARAIGEPARVLHLLRAHVDVLAAPALGR